MHQYPAFFCYPVSGRILKSKKGPIIRPDIRQIWRHCHTV
jgi:hypothetical protein